jgi:cytochrome c oxidase assembly protein subunit 11
MAANMPGDKKAMKPAKLLAVVLGMFCFGFLLVPLYDVICDVTGLNGKTGDQYVLTEALDVDESRWVTVQFSTSNNADMPWSFAPSEVKMRVRPGEMHETYFIAKNITGQRMVAQAVPSVAPFSVAQYLHKTECFCFNQQVLEAGESIQMPLKFFVDPEIPGRVSKLTLTYTLFNLPEVAANL